MRPFLLAILMSAVMPAFLVSAADEPKAAAKFVERASIELAKTEKLLKLDRDFTIELLAKWQPRAVYLAGDEAWPGMSDRIKVTETCGWVLRTRMDKNKETLDFTIATREKEWISLKAAIPLKRPEWNHIAVGRKDETLVLFFNGVAIARSSLVGLTVLESPTPLYLGVRAHAHENRRMNGYIARFAVAQTFRFPQGPKPGLIFKNDKNTLLSLTLDGQEGGVVNDSTGNGHFGVLREAEIVNVE